VARANWRFGRWLLLESLAYTASTQIYLYLTALWVGTAAAGALSAVSILVNAINVLLIGVTAHATPVARQRLVERGYDAWRRWLWQIGLGLTGAAALFAIVISAIAEPLLSFVYRPEYAAYAPIVPILAGAVTVRAANLTLIAAFRTAELPRIGFAARLISALVTLALAYPLVSRWSIAGAAGGMLFTQLVWLAVYLTCIARGALTTDNVQGAKPNAHA
jgi:O-antigen/teichoic acid export membrane protein